MIRYRTNTGAGSAPASRWLRGGHDPVAPLATGGVYCPSQMTTFAQLGLSPEILEALVDVGYEAPSPIQEQAIPLLLEGRDVIGQAQTGSGKTAAFGLPMLSYVDPTEHDVQGLVLTPTRELCIQVTQALRAYGKRKGVDVVAVFGGAPIRSQQAQLRAGGHVVVGTVGRVKDLISRHSIVLHSCRFVVLDEADEMLDLGFLEDVERILALTPSSRQTALFSATMPPEIRRLADQYLYDPVTVKVKTATLTVDTVEQFALEVAARDKTDALVDVLAAERPDQALVFVRTKIRCDQLYRTLRDRGMNVKALHGDMTQGARDGVMISFKEGRTPVLVATDVAARGLDISGISHVINFDVPISPDVYVHRIGRTGRVGRSGRAITFYEPRQRREIEAIERHAGVKLSPWVKDAHVAPTAVKPKPKRHSKPHEPVNGELPLRKLIIAGGRAEGMEPSDVIHAITATTGLDGEAIRNVRVLERFVLADVPADDAERVVELTSGTEVRGRPLRLELAAG
jgi:ATP-dependent RNA helicase DeaD